MAIKGDGVFIEKFRFSDGNTGRKLVVLLTDGNLNEPYLVVKTTSQSARYPNAKEGCNERQRVFLVRPSTPGFDADTYIQLHEIYEIPALDLVKGHLDHTIQRLFSLPSQRFNELRNCLRRLRDDISGVHFRRIFGK
jgi:hypothetical protein